jgi:hypothetical protein
MTKEGRKHLQLLRDLETQSQAQYDKLVVYLSGGAMALSFAFIRDIVGTGPVYFVEALAWAWGMWLASLLFALGSHYVSTLALRKSANEFDGSKTHYPGGIYTTLVRFLNPASGLAFLVGASFAGGFIYYNLQR